VAQGVEVVDQGLQEDAGGRHPARVGDAGVAGQRAQQLRGADPPGGDQVVGGPEAGIEPPVEPDLQDHARRLGGCHGPIGVGQGHRHQ
jgi:hypothetical protein